MYLRKVCQETIEFHARATILFLADETNFREARVSHNAPDPFTEIGDILDCIDCIVPHDQSAQMMQARSYGWGSKLLRHKGARQLMSGPAHSRLTR